MFLKLLLASLCIQLVILGAKASLPEDIANSSDDCLSNSLESSLLCRGSRAVRNILNNLSKTDKPIVIVRGLEIVPSASVANGTTQNNEINNDKSDKANTNVTDNVADDTDDTILGRFSRYLRTHELNIKFSDLMADESERYLARDLEQSGMQIGQLGEARKKDKGGGMMMMMALMMSKMMAVMGLGGLGALAMKALGVSMMALMMAGLVGLKSMSNQGHESTHSVQYVSADGHHHKRRRRSSNSGVHAPISNLLLHDKMKPMLPIAYYRSLQK